MEEVRDLARSPKARESPTMDLPSSVLPSKEGDKGGSMAGHLLPCLPSPHARFPRTATYLPSAWCWLLRHSVQLEQFG